MFRIITWNVIFTISFSHTKGNCAGGDIFEKDAFFNGYHIEKPSSGAFQYFSNPLKNSGGSFNIPYQYPFINNQLDTFTPTNVRPPGCGTPPESCSDTKYRSYDGSCNNLKNPVSGTPNTPYNRLLPANYEDRISNPRLAKSGRDLPLARSVSLLLYPDIPVEDPLFTLLAMQFGQIITHDMSMTAGVPQTGISNPRLAKSGRDLPLARSVSLLLYPDIPVEDPLFTLLAMQFGQIITHDMSMTAGVPQTEHYKARCCSPDGQLLELANVPEHCFPIIVPYNDPYHSRNGTRCMSFDRTITNRDRRCVGGSEPAEQLTSVNHYLDLSIVYGKDDEENHQLRNFEGGRLRVEKREGHQWPPRAVNASGTCRLKKPRDACYLAGDTRVNQNPQLTLLQIVLLREHNRIADVLSKYNPHWNDETTFQEARKINIAQYQHISYYEWLPNFIGWENSLKNRIIWNTQDFVTDYDENIDPRALNEHSNGAFRHFHSLIAGQLHLVHEKRYSQGSVRLSDWLVDPEIVENKFDELTRGLTTQLQFASDQYHDSENVEKLASLYETPDDVDLIVGGSLEKNVPGTLAGPTFLGILTEQFYRTRTGDRFWYENRNENTGFTLQQLQQIRKASISRLLCDNGHQLETMQQRGFERISERADKNVEKLASLYETPDDVDLIVGGSLEKNVPGTLAGPTFLGILTEQFYRTRTGDRFWYENRNENTGFTLQQLQQIRKASISRLLCDNGHQLETMQQRGFERISERNPLVRCDTLPSIDLSLWREQQFNPGGIPFMQPRNFIY
nr:peroxidase-like [Leptinotarsa decemlineata]